MTATTEQRRQYRAYLGAARAAEERAATAHRAAAANRTRLARILDATNKPNLAAIERTAANEHLEIAKNQYET